MDVLSISKYIIQKYTDIGKPITNLKLQKILYYIQGYSLKELNQPAFESQICNWPYGPVVLDAYFEYNINGGHTIEEPADQNIDYLISDRKLRKLVDRIIDSCMMIPASVLVSKTHQEAPWENTKLKEIISQDAIQNYFQKNDPLSLGKVR